MEIIRDLRQGSSMCWWASILLREGLDIPEVALVAILDADKEGFLRNRTSLIQTIGRAARNVDGRAILYADKMTDSIRTSMEETNRRRAIQDAYNQAHGITPETIRKAVDSPLDELLRTGSIQVDKDRSTAQQAMANQTTHPEQEIARLKKQMKAAAAKLDLSGQRSCATSSKNCRLWWWAPEAQLFASAPSPVQADPVPKTVHRPL